jgi:peptide/nickel transport system substrate-binding protein
VVWNLRSPGLGDPRVRQALTMLVDRTRYLQVAFHGRATQVTGPYPLESPSYDRTVQPWPYDPARARALLDAAGIRDSDGDGRREVDGKPLHIALLIAAGSKTLEPLATMMQEDFRRAGITLDVVPTEWAVMLDRLRKHAFDAGALQWAMQPVQENYDVFHSSQAAEGQNFGGLRDPEVDRLLDELRRTPPGPARIALDHQIHRRVHDLQPYTFLGCPEIDSLVAERVRGFAPSGGDLGFSSLWIAAP